MKYTIKTTSVEIKPGCWKYTQCDIYDESNNKVFEYLRNYGRHGEATFAPFTKNGQDYALFSRDYQTVEVVKLPQGEILDTKLSGMCPTALRVPMYAQWTSTMKNKEGIEKEYESICGVGSDPVADGFKSEDRLNYFDFAIMLGCYWGDDGGGWKLTLIDLKEIEQGVIKKIKDEEGHDYYEETHVHSKIEDIEIECDSNDAGDMFYVEVMYPKRGKIKIL